MTARSTRVRPEPVRDLFDPAITWSPPKEFTDYLDERRAASTVRAVPPVLATPQELDPETAPEVDDLRAELPVPATTPPPSESAPTTRNFAAASERVQSGGLLVIRERVEHGHHRYRAFERATAFFHHVTIDELTWGRIDTRRLGHLDPYGSEVFEKSLEYSLEAQTAIRQLCPETRRTVGDFGIYEGPGYVLLTVDPEPRYRAARAREVPT